MLIETFEAKNPLNTIVYPEFSEEQGGFEVLIKVETEHPFVAVTAASDTETPAGKFIQILPPEIIFEEIVKVKVYSVLGFEATELFIPINVGVMVFGVMTNIVVLLTWSTR